MPAWFSMGKLIYVPGSCVLPHAWLVFWFGAGLHSPLPRCSVPYKTGSPSSPDLYLYGLQTHWVPLSTLTIYSRGKCSHTGGVMCQLCLCVSLLYSWNFGFKCYSQIILQDASLSLQVCGFSCFLHCPVLVALFRWLGLLWRKAWRSVWLCPANRSRENLVPQAITHTLSLLFNELSAS